MVEELPPKKRPSRPLQDEKKLQNEEIKTSNIATAIMVCWFVAFVLFFTCLAIMMLLNKNDNIKYYGFYLTFPAAFIFYFLYLGYLKHKNRRVINPYETDRPVVASIPLKLFYMCATLCFILFLIMGSVIQYSFGWENIHNLRKFSQYQKASAEVLFSKTENPSQLRTHNIIKVRFQFNNKEYEPTLKREYILFQNSYLKRPNFLPGEKISVYVNPKNVPDYIFLGRLDYFGRLVYDLAPILFIIISLTGICFYLPRIKSIIAHYPFNYK